MEVVRVLMVGEIRSGQEDVACCLGVGEGHEVYRVSVLFARRRIEVRWVKLTSWRENRQNERAG